MRRAVDYLESRPDIDRSRLAFYGLSVGADYGAVNFPLDESRRPLFRLFGAPEADKERVLFESGHVPPSPDVVREMLDALGAERFSEAFGSERCRRVAPHADGEPGPTDPSTTSSARARSLRGPRRP